MPNKSPPDGPSLSFDTTIYAKPLTYQVDRAKEPTPPTFQDLLDDLAACGPNDPVFKITKQSNALEV
jgi:hypothetical protein